MDNFTHSLVGVAIGELAQPATATPGQRRVLLAGSVVAANLPDIDLAYTWITPAPLGYLLHHRGHTHTLAGLAALGLLLAVVVRLWPAVRGSTAHGRERLWVLMAINLVIHVSLDAFNTYGVHPFYPVDVRWFYGDAVFIFEPLIWLVLGIAAACNARARTTRLAIVALVAVLLLAVATAGIVPLTAVATITVVGSLFFGAVRHAQPRTRAGAAVAFTTLFLVGMSGLSRVVKADAVAAVTPGGEIVDVIVSPDPGMPVCWSVIVIARDKKREELRTDRGTRSLTPAWYRPDSCASYRLARRPESQVRFAGSVAWHDDLRASLAALRDLSGRDCWVRAWLQFGRAPVVRDNLIMDLRFDNGFGSNFTAMPLARTPEEGCPSNITRWALPRADLLDPAP